MTSRRDVLHVAALSGLPALFGGTITATGQTQVPLGIDLPMVLADARHAEARAFAACLSHCAGAVSTLTDGDVTAIWLRELGPAWRVAPHAVAGLTARPALFCLEQLAASYGLRVVFHAEHVIGPGEAVQHSLLRGAQESHLAVDDLAQAGPRWPARIAAAMTIHRQQARPQRLGPSDAALEPAMPAGARLLTSWIIAPV